MSFFQIYLMWMGMLATIIVLVMALEWVQQKVFHYLNSDPDKSSNKGKLLFFGKKRSRK